ncbi:tRNA 5-methoxyuridine(34)/uridine 5-oxyacetic acid(34) synthase CmoB [bacterium]|nr:tRNA 5-methoxyuridine(34)/uridine 5-oxyacetic acid(34) synthase CmoB [bacterium]|tara:strand:- start:3995 stop:4852 length:858 start_codon:yes stop_codon:yes gene_type:complete
MYWNPPLDANYAATIREITQKWPENDWRKLYSIITKPGPWDLARLESVALQLRPWRKGPIVHSELTIDAEWDCRLKWARLHPLLPSIVDKTVLDIGSNNGYFTRKFKLAGARYVTGIEPTFIYTMQFIAQQRWAPIPGIQTLPMTLDTISSLDCVDIIVCMGILYYCSDPKQSIKRMHHQLHPNGQLWLETLTMPEKSLTLDAPFAGIRKIKQVPNVPTLIDWIHEAGFSTIQVLDTAPTQSHEQRATLWSHHHSLNSHLNRGDGKTTDGHPTPNRTLICAHKLG